MIGSAQFSINFWNLTDTTTTTTSKKKKEWKSNYVKRFQFFMQDFQTHMIGTKRKENFLIRKLFRLHKRNHYEMKEKKIKWNNNIIERIANLRLCVCLFMNGFWVFMCFNFSIDCRKTEINENKQLQITLTAQSKWFIELIQNWPFGHCKNCVSVSYTYISSIRLFNLVIFHFKWEKKIWSPIFGRRKKNNLSEKRIFAHTNLLYLHSNNNNNQIELLYRENFFISKIYRKLFIIS